MARILIGNIQGPQGKQGIQGKTGATGLQGPQGPLPPLVADYLATATGTGALDAYMGKLIDARLNDLMNKFTTLNGEGLFQVKVFSTLTKPDIDRFPEVADYGKTIIRIFNSEFDAIVIENTSLSGNYSCQLYASSDSLKFRRRQSTQVWPEWREL